MDSSTIAENFDKYFEIKVASTEKLKQESFKIRHKVYAEELGWEPTSDDGLEVDQCDKYAFSLLLHHKTSKTFAGTVRLVIPPPTAPARKLPFELHCTNSIRTDVIDPTTLPRGSFGEISRLSVPETFRRRVNEQKKPFIVGNIPSKEVFSEEERRNFPNIAIGLYLSVIALGEICNHSHMFVVVEPRLKRRLGHLGLNFIQCGDELEHHGTRALFVINQKDYSSQLNAEMKELYDLLKSELKSQLFLYPYHWEGFSSNE